MEEMEKGHGAKMEVLKDLVKQMYELMSAGHGDEEIGEEKSLTEELAEEPEMGDMPMEEPEFGAPKKKKVMLMAAMSGKKAPPMKGSKRYG